jgi:hypothetical protein
MTVRTLNALVISVPSLDDLVTLLFDFCGFIMFADTDTTGFSGVEFLGTADSQTRLADSRVAQISQALAYPNNVLNPVNPLTCAQVGLRLISLSQDLQMHVWLFRSAFLKA